MSPYVEGHRHHGPAWRPTMIMGLGMPGKIQSLSNAIDRPFATDVVAHAGKIAEQYHVILASADREWHGRGLEPPRASNSRWNPASGGIDAAREGQATCVRKNSAICCFVIWLWAV